MVDAQTLTTMFGGIGVGVAAIYYVMMLRNVENIRRKDLIVQRLQLPLQYHDAYWTALNMMDWNTLEELYLKYGRLSSGENWDKFIKLNMLLSHYNGLGILMKDKLVDAEQIFQLYLPWSIMAIWEKFLPLMMRNRILPSGVVHNPDAFKGFELLYLEAKRLYPKAEIVDLSTREKFLESTRLIQEQLRKNPVPH
jgi:hypothetical protein